MSFSFPVQDNLFDDKDDGTTVPTQPQAEDVDGGDATVPVSESNTSDSEERDGIAPIAAEGTVVAGSASGGDNKITAPLVSGLAALVVGAAMVVGFRKYRASRNGSAASMLLSESSEDPSLASTV